MLDTLKYVVYDLKIGGVWGYYPTAKEAYDEVTRCLQSGFVEPGDFTVYHRFVLDYPN